MAESDSAFTLDVIVLDLGGEKYDIHNLDMEKVEKLPDGEQRVPIIGVNEALSRYGKVRDQVVGL